MAKIRVFTPGRSDDGSITNRNNFPYLFLNIENVLFPNGELAGRETSSTGLRCVIVIVTFLVLWYGLGVSQYGEDISDCKSLP